MSSTSGPSQKPVPAPSSNFKSMLDAALAEYKKKTGNDLLSHWLASELKTCEDVDAILEILRDQAKAFERSDDQKLMRWIDPLVNVLFTFSNALGDGVSLAFPPAKVIFTGIGALLGAAKDVRSSHGAIIDLFERIESFFKRLEVYTQISLTTKMAEVLVKIVIELLSILSIATKEVKRPLAKLFARKLLGRTDIEDALKRLDTLIQEEVQMAIAQILKATNEVKDGTDKANIAMQQMLDDVEEVKCDVVEVKRDVGEVKCDVEEVKWAQIEQDIHKWFSPPDPSTNYNTACEAQSEGTTTWFFQGAKFEDWTSMGSLLWIHGKPGSGKSILCSAIIKHAMSLRETGQANLAFFYFDFRDEDKKQDLRNFVKSLLVQLSTYLIPCGKIISRIYSTHGKGKQQPSNDVLKTCLREMLSVTAEKPIYLIVDALDECPDFSGMPTPREDVLTLLESLVRLGLPNLRICVTSRPDFDIKNVLGPLASSVVSLHDESGQIKDISDYVSKAVYSDKKMGRWRRDQKELVIEELSNKADGMFRWVFCQMEVLRHCLPASIRQTLDQLPKSLDDTYLRVLSQIPQANQAHAHRMLQCLVVAVRPLYVAELAELLAFEFDAAQGGIPKYRAALRLDDQTQAVLSTCSSLVTILDERDGSRIVQFSHFSVKEFLVSNRLASSFGDISRYYIRLGSAHTVLAQACLGLLVNSDEESVQYSPLANYAAEHWVDHAQFKDVALHVRDGMETLFDPDKPHFAAWVEVYDIDQMILYREERGNPLYYSVLYGFYNLVRHLVIKHPHLVNAVSGGYVFPLLAAMAKGHVDVSELLLKHGADVDAREETGMTILLVVLSESFLEDKLSNVVEFLLKHGADVNARDNEFRSPLHLADRVEPGVVQILLKNKADVNSQDKYGNTPLQLLLESDITSDNMAFGNGHDVSDIVRLLLEHGAEVNIRDKHNYTPLLRMVEDNWFVIAEILLEHGADPNAEKNNGMKPLQILSETDIEFEDDALDLVSLLLKHGAEMNSRNKHNKTLLHVAIQRDQYELAKILLEHGADANVEDTDGATPLHHLSCWERRELEPECSCDDVTVGLGLLLLKHGAEVDSRDVDNHTPLHLAISETRIELAGILLEHGANANAKDIDGMTPLHQLSESGIEDEGEAFYTVMSLLKHGADVDSRDMDNHTPLHLVMKHAGVGMIAEILLENGADANSRNNEGMTPLLILSTSKIKEEDYLLNLVLLLLKHGAEVNSRTQKDSTPLHLVLHKKRFKLARILLEHGADANAENIAGTTPLHVLSGRKLKDEGDALNLVPLLLKHDAEVNSRDKNKDTSLHLAIKRDRFKLAGILLENGADANAENINGETPLFKLSESRDCDEGHFVYHARLLLEHGVAVGQKSEDKKTSLLLGIDATMEINTGELSDSESVLSRGHHGSQERGLIVAQRPLQCAVDFNMRDENQTRSQMATTFSQSNLGPSQIATLLINYGADPKSVKNWGESPLYQEIEDVNIQIKNHLTPLHLVSFYGWVEMARVLLDRGASANSEDHLGRTPLHLVAKGSSDLGHDGVGVAQLLLEHGSDVNAQDKHNTTPLHMASYFGKVVIVRVLLGCGANSSAKDAQGQTPLHMVSRGAYFSQEDGVGIAQILLEHGADVNAQDSNCVTPLDSASHHGRLELAALLLNYGDEVDAKIDQGQATHQLESEAVHYHDKPTPST